MASKNKLGQKKDILLLVLILFVIVVLGYLLWNKYSTKTVDTQQTQAIYPLYSSPSPEATTQPTPTPRPVVLDTSTWKTYTNPAYHFSIKYPSNLTIKNETKDSYGIRTQLLGFDSQGYSSLNIYLLDNPKKLTVSEFIKQLPDYEGGKFVKPINPQPSFFSGMDAIEANGFGGAGNTGNQALVEDSYGNVINLFTSDLDSNTVYTIFSTFKFN